MIKSGRFTKILCNMSYEWNRPSGAQKVKGEACCSRLVAVRLHGGCNAGAHKRFKAKE
jgi:hypothetical protein